MNKITQKHLNNQNIPKTINNDQNTLKILKWFYVLRVLWSFLYILEVSGVFWSYLGFQGYFGHFGHFWCILVIFYVLRVFWSFLEYIGLFLGFKGIMVIFRHFGSILVIIEVLLIFWSIMRFNRYFGHFGDFYGYFGYFKVSEGILVIIQWQFSNYNLLVLFFVIKKKKLSHSYESGM